jgi:meso-butanediol dehydrogenase/(S,S)-butanediol dehydrogenase/diacetyl reductase
MRLKDKVALITGGGAGIGAATARAFCREGATVLLVDQDEQALRRTAKTLQGRAMYFAADVADEKSAAAAVAKAVKAFGRLDILVNNAAMRNYSAVAKASAAEWRAVLGVNLVGAAAYCRAALPALRRTGNGSIVNVSSCYALTGRKGMAIYDASKAALIALTRTLAHEEIEHGVRANAVCPGSTLTDFHVKRGKAAGKSMAELRRARDDNSLMGRWADPSEIAFPILWLASDEASFVTGATLAVDGGLSIF